MKNSILKKLAGETAVYGITHTLGRFINFLLVPFYTGLFTEAEYGLLSLYYAIVGFAIVVLMYGMETAFFNFARSVKAEKVFSTGQISLIASTIMLLFIGLTFQTGIANFLEHPEQTNFVRIFLFILSLDTLSNLPLAWLRYEKRPMRFGIIRLTNIAVNIGLNLFFYLLAPKLQAQGINVPLYDGSLGIGYVFVSNLIASLVMFLLLLPQWRNLSEGFDAELWRKMWRYGRPLILIGLAGIVNETLDRVLLQKMLPGDIAEAEIGIYSGFYKLAMLMTIFVQSFRFAAEPFFFEQSKGQEPKKIYAKVMHYFIIVLTFIFLSTMVFMHQVGPIILRNEAFFQHKYATLLTPILLLANLFLGAMYNLNIWYKLNDKMHLGTRISIGGAVGTIVLNIALIPLIGILGSAVATLLVYFGMCVASYTMGQKHYPVPYNLRIIFFYIIAGLILYGIYLGLSTMLPSLEILWSFVALFLYVLLVYRIEGPIKKSMFAAK